MNAIKYIHVVVKVFKRNGDQIAIRTMICDWETITSAKDFGAIDWSQVQKSKLKNLKKGWDQLESSMWWAGGR